MVSFDPKMNPLLSQTPMAGSREMPEIGGLGANAGGTDFAKVTDAVNKYMSTVNETQKASDTAIEDLLTGKNNDLTSVVSAVAEADVSFKVLVGVRNKLIDAYKQTMSMPL
jgi:flagellar hook-basal body complex protein FliE